MCLAKIIDALSNTGGRSRNDLIAGYLMNGKTPLFLERMHTVTVRRGEHVLTYKVSPDYLCLGADDDWLHMPMTPLACKEWMASRGFCLPTKTMVDQIHAAATTRLPVITWNGLYDRKPQKFNRDSMRCFIDHSHRLQTAYGAAGAKPGDFVSGHKKDVVLSNALTREYRGNVAIYGWFGSDGKPVQGFNPKSHSVQYVDYSHGIRCVSADVELDGQKTKIESVFSHPDLCMMLHDEPLRFQSY